MFNIRNILGLRSENSERGINAKDESDIAISNLPIANVSYTSVIKYRSKQNQNNSRTFETFSKCRSRYEDYQELHSSSGF